MGTIRVGTSSWASPTLVKESRFYPPNVRTSAERLRFNNSYRDCAVQNARQLMESCWRPRVCP
jgi:hypothetical protein